MVANAIFCLFILVSNDIPCFSRFYESVELDVPKWRDLAAHLKYGFFMSLINLLNITIGLSSLQIVNIPMFATLRRCVILFTLIVELVWLRRLPTKAAILACIFICGGALVAGGDKLTVDGYGYGLVLISNLLTSLYSVL